MDLSYVVFSENQEKLFLLTFGEKWRPSPEFEEWYRTEANCGRRLENAVRDLQDNIRRKEMHQHDGGKRDLPWTGW